MMSIGKLRPTGRRDATNGRIRRSPWFVTRMSVPPRRIDRQANRNARAQEGVPHAEFGTECQIGSSVYDERTRDHHR